MLARKVRYTIGSQELMNMFLKGLNHFPYIVERIINKSPMDYYNLKQKTITMVKNQQLLHVIKNNLNPSPFQCPYQRFNNNQPPQYNLSNAP